MSMAVKTWLCVAWYDLLSALYIETHYALPDYVRALSEIHLEEAEECQEVSSEIEVRRGGLVMAVRPFLFFFLRPFPL